jgi:pyridoxamine 5'-phosphate oxidase
MKIMETQPSPVLRDVFGRKPLDGAKMDPDPLVVFGEWFDEARASEVVEANAMSLATAGADGRVTCRTVLLKAWDARGFIFFTNYTSEKARQIGDNPHAALLFPWLTMGRQVEVSGRVEKISSAESLRYFLKRPFKSQVSAWTSCQSAMITSRALLEAKFQQMLLKFRAGKVPLPDSWGGFRVIPETIEFWQSAPHRLHDRIFYKRNTRGEWRQFRLQP